MTRLLRIGLAMSLICLLSVPALEAASKGGGRGKGGGGKKTVSGSRTTRPKRDRTTRTRPSKPSRKRDTSTRSKRDRKTIRSDRSGGGKRDRDLRNDRRGGGKRDRELRNGRRGGGKDDRELRSDRRGGGKRDRELRNDRRGGGKRDRELRGSKRDGYERPGRGRIDRSSLEGLKGRDRAFELQRLNEEQKLNHRLDNADRLRDLSERSGNQRLAETADRMEQNAYTQYDRRIDRIEQQQSRFRQQDGEGDSDGDGGADSDSDGDGGTDGDSDGDDANDDSGGDADSDSGDDGHDHPDGEETDGDEDGDGDDDADDHADEPADPRQSKLDKRLLNEERKLNHRLGQADHLRQIAERNGNPQLLDTADRMEQKAWDHYDKRTAKLRGDRGGDSDRDTGDSGDTGGDSDADPDDDFDSDPDDFDNDQWDDDGSNSDSDAHDDDAHDGDADSGYEGSRKYQKQLANEQRKLDKRLQQAEHLRGIAERNGNPNLLRTADRMEQKAFDHYDRRLTQIGQKEGLNDLSTDPLPPDLDSTQAGRYAQSLRRQVAYEEQRLDNRLDTVQRIRQWGERTNNQDLLNSADRLEERALDDYQQRLDRLDQFRDQYSQLDGLFSTTGESYWRQYDGRSYGRFRRIFGR